MSTSRTGLYGGTFDPIHLGHFKVAEAALTEAELDRVVFIPSATPPHKDGAICPFDHRLAMLRLACGGKEHFITSSIEADLPKPSYTVDTLRAIMDGFGRFSELYFIIGADAFLDIMTWKDFEKVLQQVHIILSPRVGYCKYLGNFLARLGYCTTEKGWSGPSSPKKIQLLESVPPQISSTDIKAAQGEASRAGTTDNYGLDPRVAEYIKEHGLYRK